MDEFSPAAKPAFLHQETAEAIGYVGADTVPEFDHELAAWNDPAYIPPATEVGDPAAPSHGYRERWRAIARYHALGLTNNQICAKLGYSPASLSTTLRNPWIQAEVQRYRSQYEVDIATRVKDAATDGIERIHRIILDASEKSTTALDASKWAVEKASGKARQEVTVESGTLSTFMEMLKEMRSRGEPVDVTQTVPALAGDQESAAVHPERWDSWFEEHLA